MEDKMKFVAIGLAAALLISIFANFQSYISRKSVEASREALSRENSALNKKIEQGLAERKNLNERLDALKTDLGNLTKEKDDLDAQKNKLQKQYEDLVKERDDLQKRLKGEVSEARQSAASHPSSAEESYWAGVLRTKTDLAAQVESLRAELAKFRITNDQLKRDKASLELDFNNVTRDKDYLEQQMRSLDSVSMDLVREKNIRIKTQTDLSDVKRENSSLRRQLRYLNNRKANLEIKLQKLQQEKESLQRQFDEMGNLLENKVSQMGDVRRKLETIREGGTIETAESSRPESVELPPIVVRPQSDIPVPAANISEVSKGIGRVIEADRKNKFVIIDLGEDYGIRIGTIFHVYRSGRLAGTIEAVQVRKGITACDIKEEKTPIRVGDIIK